MPDRAALLAALQHGDSFFPGGAVAFSWGLETLAGEDRVSDGAAVDAYLRAQLHGRWATFDRPATIAAHRAGDDLDAIAALDHLVEAQTLSREQRDGSRRMGAALLAVHDRIGTPGAAAYGRRVRGGEAPGHSAVVQGLVWRRAGIAESQADAMSAHQLCVALLGAALRLGLIGHIEAQSILTTSRPVIVVLLDTDPPAIDDIGAFVPQAEIAIMRHETHDSRLFGN